MPSSRKSRIRTFSAATSSIGVFPTPSFIRALSPARVSGLVMRTVDAISIVAARSATTVAYAGARSSAA
ncbi:MAG: hypothetical protein NT090_00600 [Acidobacteria bacterium]|nr:hypothetical protein [Acidobacteriota bacterium]